MSKEHIRVHLLSYNHFLREQNPHREKITWGQALVTNLEERLLHNRIQELIADGRTPHQARMVLVNELEAGRFPRVDKVSAQDFMEAANAHGCPVAYLISRDSERSLEKTVESYLVKNRVFRHFKRVLSCQGENELLLAELLGEEELDPKEKGISTLTRPRATRDRLQGIEQLHAYWPCQLLRVIDGIARGWDCPKDFATQNPNAFQIHWENFDDLFGQATNLEDFDVRLALRLVEILRCNQVEDRLIAQIILRGYDPIGPLKEHGQINKICNGVWPKLMIALREGCNCQDLVTTLEMGLWQKLEKYQQELEVNKKSSDLVQLLKQGLMGVGNSTVNHFLEKVV